MIEKRIQNSRKNTSNFSDRLIVITIIFLIPSAVLFYSLIWNKNSGFVFGQFSGYISLLVFLIIYFALIKLITWILKALGIKWR